LAARKRKSLADWQRRYYRIDCELLGLFDSNSPSLAVGREPSALYRKLFDVALECYANVKSICRPGITSEELIAATSVIEQNGFTTYDSVFNGEAGTAPELGTRSAAHPLEPWTLIENMVHVIQPNPITRDCKAGLQLGAAVLVKPTGGEALHTYPFNFRFAGCHSLAADAEI
jgi:Xaa-Pro aminopeptidase